MIVTDISPVLSKTEEFIEIDYITQSGSAFAVCKNGDQVFLNKRLVKKMDLNEGDICKAFLLKNYDDKIDMTPWRAVRVLMAA